MAREENGLPKGLPAKFPPHKDWRIANGGVLNPVKDKKKCYMCWAIVASEATAAGLYISGRTDNLLQLAASELLDCCRSQAIGCYNYSIREAFAYIRDRGIREEVDYPFVAAKGDCRPKTVEEDARAYRIRGIVKVDKKDEIMLLKAVLMRPIAAGIQVTVDFEELEGEIYEGSNNFVYQPGTNEPVKHAILIVGYGYDEKEEKPYWLIKNSWGRKWGINGYGRIVRSSSSSLLFATKYPVF